jgi:1-acyl-sn-glycerol-3-phosphate acyltransferase
MIRVVSIALALLALTLVLLPFHLMALAFDLRLQRTIPRLYHRVLCAMIGVRIREIGRRSTASPTLILSNHVSWLDITVISALAPVVFVAKSEVARWPVFGMLARLQRTVFVDRSRRHRTAAVNAEIARRLADGDPVVLFAEGTSSDGNRVLEFRSALVGAMAQVEPEHEVLLQPASIGYTRVQGVPLGRRHRPLVAWYGDLDFTPHFKEMVRRGPFDVTVTFGEPVRIDGSQDRKAVARSLEATVRRLTAAALREPTPKLNAAA